MEHLIKDLKEKLVLRREKEYAKVNEYESNKNKELVLISSGKIIELNRTIKLLENMLDYYKQMKGKEK